MPPGGVLTIHSSTFLSVVVRRCTSKFHNGWLIRGNIDDVITDSTTHTQVHGAALNYMEGPWVGVQPKYVTVLPHAINHGAMFDVDLVTRLANLTGNEMIFE